MGVKDDMAISERFCQKTTEHTMTEILAETWGIVQEVSCSDFG